MELWLTVSCGVYGRRTQMKVVELGEVFNAPLLSMLDVKHRQAIGAGSYRVFANFVTLNHDYGDKTKLGCC